MREGETDFVRRMAGVTVEDASEQLPGSLHADFLGLQLERAGQQPLFQEGADLDGEPALEQKYR